MDDTEKQAILDGYYHEIQKMMAPFPINRLPASLLVDIFKFVPADDIHKLRQVCRSWYSILAVAADNLPKRHVDWLELKIESDSQRPRSKFTAAASRESMEVVLLKQNVILWYFTDFSRFFDDMRANGLIFCGRVTFGPNTPVGQCLPSLLTLKENVRFRPNCLNFLHSNMTNLTEQELLDCINCFNTSLKSIDLNGVSIEHMSNTVLGNLLRRVPEVLINYNAFHIVMLGLVDAVNKWIVDEPRSCILYLHVADVFEAKLIKHHIRYIGGLRCTWKRSPERIGKFLHPRSPVDDGNGTCQQDFFTISIQSR